MKATHLVTLASLITVASLATAAPKPTAPDAAATAESVTITIELDRSVQPADRSGVAAIKVSLQPERIRPEQARPPMPPAIARDRPCPMNGRKQFAPIEAEGPHRQPGHKRQSADVNENYNHAPSRNPRQHRANGEVRYSENEETVRRGANKRFTRAVEDNRVAMPQRQAIAQREAGQNQETAAPMRAQNREVTEMNPVYRDEETGNRARNIDADARQPDERRLSNRQRKDYRNNSYQPVNQQRRLD